MNRRGFNVLLALNILFASLLVYSFFAPRKPALSPMQEPIVINAHRNPGPGRMGKDRPPLSVVLYRTNQFHWREVESEDYRTYIGNLRKIGCPENTIKDIILTDVMKLYAARRGQFFHNGKAFRFWETNERRALNARQLEEKERQLAQIDKELPPVLRDLLGINYEREINKYFVDTQEDDRRLGFLDGTKHSRILALREEIETLREDVLERAGSQPTGPEEIAALKQIERQRKQRLGEILSQEELTEYELRTSETAERLRAELVGFNPTEEEFRSIYELRKALDDRFLFQGTAEEKKEAEHDLDEMIRARLGDRVADYDRAKNNDFRNLVLFTETHELPSSTAAAIMEIKQIAEQERRSLFANRGVAEPERLAALRAIESETEKGVKDTLGEKLFRKYSQNAGSWVRHLSSPPSASLADIP